MEGRRQQRGGDHGGGGRGPWRDGDDGGEGMVEGRRLWRGGDSGGERMVEGRRPWRGRWVSHISELMNRDNELNERSNGPSSLSSLMIQSRGIDCIHFLSTS